MTDLSLPADAHGLWSVAPLIGIVAFSAVFRGFTGFGFAITAVPLLSLAVPPVLAVTLAAGLQLVGGLLDFRSAAPMCHWPSVRWLALGAVVTSPLGTLLLAWLSADMARLAVGAACAAAVVALASGFAFRVLPGRGISAGVGALSGLFNGLAAMPGPPALAYYLASPLKPAQVRASLMVIFLISAVASNAGLAAVGAIGRREVLLVLAGVPVMLVGSSLGAALFRRAGGAHRNVSLLTLAFVALAAVARGLTGLLP
jgi:uncharacterized membrane protein YfcA